MTDQQRIRIIEIFKRLQEIAEETSEIAHSSNSDAIQRPKIDPLMEEHKNLTDEAAEILK